MLEVIPKHFEDDFPQRKPILIGFKQPLLGSVPNADNLSIDCPDNVVEEITKKSEEVFNDVDNFEVSWLFRLYIFDNRGYLIDPFQKFEYLSCILHCPSQFVRHLSCHATPTSKILQDFTDFRVFVAVVVEIGDILNNRAYFIPAFACLHDHGES